MRLLPVLLFLIASVAECLMLSRVVVPQYKLYGEDALLKCEYDLRNDRLYAVKWYKDNEEFFRFVPRYKPPIAVHNVDGVRVEITKSDDKRVFLRSVTVKSTGFYRCEVSAEAPLFSSIMGEGRMTVVYLPKEAPQITGNAKDEYEVGDVLDLNCTSSKSFPPAKISWYINDTPVEVPWAVSHFPASPDPPVIDPYDGGGYMTSYGNTHSHQLRHYSSSSPASGGGNALTVSSLRLQLPLRAHHFGPKGTAKVRCVARISPLFWQDGDEKIFGYSSSHTSNHHHSNQMTHNRHQNSNKKTAIDDIPEYGSFANSAYEDEHHTKSIHTLPHDHSSFGQGLSFQREALVLVRGGCSSRYLLPGGGQFSSWPALCTSCLFLVLLNFWIVTCSGLA